LPEAHFLESWGDSRAIDGTVSLQQPLIAPLYDGKSVLEVMSLLNGSSGLTSYQILKSFWAENSRINDPIHFEAFFKTAIHDGVLKDTALKVRQPRVRTDWVKITKQKPSTKSAQAIDVKFVADPTIWDGRFANNAWLQELPKPVTQLTWDNAALISPNTAKNLNIKTGDVIRLNHEQKKLEAAVFVLPGHADNAVTLSMGYGRTRAGANGNLRGYDAYVLQSLKSPFWIDGVSVEKTLKSTRLADTQIHHQMEGRDLVVRSTVDEFKKKGQEILPRKLTEPHPSLMPEYPYA
jgi:molybdopterin-containing oxidoreductase family iron-sulfur binding subunit